jgi:hypothetical protein
MSKAFIASIIRQSAELTGSAAGDLMQTIRQELKKDRKIHLTQLRNLHRTQDEGW